MNGITQFPRQALPDRRKTAKWGRQCLLWGDSRSFQNFNPVRRSVRHKRINYDLLRGKLHMEDVSLILNPADVQADYIPEKIQHYPIMNAKLEVLIGEELKRPFDWRAVVTNMNAISEIEETKRNELLQSFRQIIEDQSLSEEDYSQKLNELDEYYTYNWQDFREIRANEFIRHYSKEYNMPLIFNEGFRDALTCGEEIYRCDIIGGEPVIERLNPLKIRIFRSGRSNKIEDADIIIIEDYWSPGQILDTFGDQLKKKDIEYLENMPNSMNGTDGFGLIDDRKGMIPRTMLDEGFTFDNDFLFSIDEDLAIEGSLSPYDEAGNVRVLQMYWKSKRQVKKVKSYDPETGEETINFYRGDYVIDESLGEEEQDLWINEAWEGTLIGGTNTTLEDHENDGTYGIFVNIRPRPIQYSRLLNPSRCHLGIVGTIYNLNDDKPFSLVDMMKPYNYLYDVLHYRLADAIASSWGQLAEIDLAKVPDDWTFDKWMYFAKVNHLAVSNSMNEIQEGPAKGKLVGQMNNNTQRVISDASGNYIQQLMNLAEWTKAEMGEIVGVTKQREGQIANRETVGGVERSVLQSSYITERYFAIHNDTKRRALECFVETSKIAARGRKIKFSYILSDGSRRLMEFDGDEFAENDYGIVVDNSSDILNLDAKLDAVGQAALQNQAASLSDIMRMWNAASSLGEKIRILERSEQKRQQQAQQAQQAQLEQAQQQLEIQAQLKQAEMDHQAALNSENNETKILVAQIQAESMLQGKQIDKENDGIQDVTPDTKAKLMEQIREFDLKLKQDDKKLDLEKERNSIARIGANRQNKSK